MDQRFFLFYQDIQNVHKKVRKKAKISNQYNQVSHLTQDTIYSNKNTRKHHIKESQEVNHFSPGDHKAVRTERQYGKNKHK